MKRNLHNFEGFITYHVWPNRPINRRNISAIISPLNNSVAYLDQGMNSISTDKSFTSDTSVVSSSLCIAVEEKQNI